MSEDGGATARAYYETIDASDYEGFADLLTPDVVHERPDRTIEGREALVRFMREDRPRKDTTHEVHGVFAASDGAAVEGRLLAADGARLFAFVDVFDLEDGRIARIRTYTR